MTPAARIKASLDLLENIEKSRVPMDSTIGDYMRPRSYVGAKDRKDIVERVYGVVRHKARLSWWLETLSESATPRAMLMAFMTKVSGADAKRMKDLFDGSNYGPEPLTDEERAFILKLTEAGLDHPDMPDTVAVECPVAHEEALRAYFGAEFKAEMASMLEGAPLDLRVNTVMVSREKAQDALEKDDVPCAPTRWAPAGLRVQGKTYLSKTKAFNKGWVDIQDEGSQLIAAACDARPGMQVLDYCAGAGGKTLALANAMQVKGRIVAMDTEKARLEKSRDRFRRAHVSDIIEVRPLEEDRHRGWLRRQKETFDVVLTDVPCSGSGTWRRNPDTRWRVFGPSFEELLKTQAEILDRVAPILKIGGRLVYATCSILPAENEEQIAAFLARHPEYQLLPLAKAWPAGMDVPCAGDVMRLTPLRHGTDGFFAAVLQRIARPPTLAE